jgi:hypothetical protein
MRLLFLIVYCTYFLNLVIGDYSYSEARSKFEGTIFIVKYNYHPTALLITTHYRIWSRVFNFQMIFVPWSKSEISAFTKSNIGANWNASIVSHTTDMEVPGSYGYEIATIAMKSVPNAVGYLYAHDDMAMNVSRLMELDSNSVWRISENTRCDLDLTWQDRNHEWPWWNGKYGIPAIDNFHLNRADVAVEMKECFGGERVWYVGQADFFYIPQGYKDVFIRVMSAFGENKIFVEIAVPSFLMCYVPSDHQEMVTLCTAWDQHRGDFSYMESVCGKKASLFHPVKLSFKPNVARMKAKMALTGLSEEEDKDKTDRNSIWSCYERNDCFGSFFGHKRKKGH